MRSQGGPASFFGGFRPNAASPDEAKRRLAGAYLAAGNIEEARNHYREAFRLFPSEENEKLVTAMEKRRKADNPQPDGASN
jgi:Flp pilus assembly protein TadD